MRNVYQPIFLALFLGACTSVGTALLERDAVVDSLKPKFNTALETVIQETWESRVPCIAPASTWLRRIARGGQGEADRFIEKCDPFNLVPMGTR